MIAILRFVTIYTLLSLVVLSCAGSGENNAPLKVYPLDSLDNLIAADMAVLDTRITSDGSASIKFSVQDSTVIQLFNAGDIDIERANLIYQAKIRTESLQGNVYLEMWCRFPDQGYFFSRSLFKIVTGTTNWETIETPFILNKNENPDEVILNLVVTGSGTVWIDDIKLLRTDLK